MHSVKRQTDEQMDDMMMPIADHTVQQYERLKLACTTLMCNAASHWREYTIKPVAETAARTIRWLLQLQ